MKKLWEQWKNSKRMKATVVIGSMVLVMLIMSCLMLPKDTEILDDDIPLSEYAGPTVYYEEEALVRGQEVEIDVKVCGLPGQYPAASFEMVFPKNKLEFIGIRQGNLEITNTRTGEVMIPKWQFNVENANHTGIISTMYLDMTAEENPIDGALVGENKDVLFRLVFRVKDSSNVGESLVLKTKQATFAAIDEDNSLAIYKSNINTPDGSYEVKAE